MTAAVPALTPNSPAVGSIAWGPFTIRYNGGSFAVAAGSTNLAFTWWRYNDGVPVLEAGNDLPQTLGPDDLVLFGNKNGTAINLQSATLVEGGLIVDGSILTDALSANSVTALQILAGSVDASKIAADTITANQIASNAITANELAAGAVTANKLSVILGGGNQLYDSSFESSTTVGNVVVQGANTALYKWYRHDQGGTLTNVLSTRAFRGTQGLQIQGNTAGGYQSIRQLVPMLPNTKYVLSAWVWLDAAVTTSSATNVAINVWDGSTNAADGTPWSAVPVGKWTRVVCNITSGNTPAAGGGHITLFPPVNTYAVFDAVQFEEGELPTAYSPKTTELLPGTILASMIGADQINAGHILADSITADELAVGAVTATEIAAGAVTANKLNVTIGGGNLVANSGFENPLTDGFLEAYSGGAYVRHTTAANVFRGSASLAVTPGAVTRGVIVWASGQVATQELEAGTPIVCSVRVKGTAGSVFTLAGRVRNSTTGSLTEGGGGVNFTTDGTWQWIKTTSWTYATGPFLPGLQLVQNSGTFTNVLYVDSAQIEIGDVATAWSPKTDEILPGSIVATMIAADSITATQIAANAIGVSELNAGAVTADKVAAGAITTEKLTVASVGDTAVLNGSFEELAAADATLPAGFMRNVAWGGTATTSLVTTTSPIGGSRSVNLIATPKVAVPTGVAVSTATTGGTLPASTTHSYRVAAERLRADGTTGVTTAATGVTVVTGAGTATNANTVTWAAVTGATGYRVYGRTAGTELLIATVGAVTTYTDTGSVTPAGALPGSDSTFANADIGPSSGLPVVPGEQWFFSFTARNSLAGISGMYARLRGGTTAAAVGVDVVGITGNSIENAVAATTATTYSAVFTIPAGMTFARPVVMLYGQGQTTGAAINTLTVDDITFQKVTVSARIADGAIVATKIATDAVEAGKIKADAVTATKIAADAVTSAKIAAGAIVANKLSVIMGGGNQLANSGFESTPNTVAPWGAEANTTTAVSTADKYRGTRSLLVTHATAGGAVSAYVDMPTVVGQRYVFSAYVKRAAGTQGVGANVTASTYTGAIGAVNTYVAAPTAWTRIAIYFQATAASHRINVHNASALGTASTGTGSAFYMDQAQFEEGEVGTAYAPMPDEILPGTIQANMIQANAITATQIAANTLTAAEIATGAITADEIGADAVTAAKIAAGAVTANKLNVVMGGGNLVVNSGFENGVAGYNQNVPAGSLIFATSGDKYRGTTATRIESAAGVTSIAQNFIPVQPGTTYTGSVWVRRLSGTGLIRLTVSDQGEQAFANKDRSTAINTWERLTATFTATTNQAYIRVLTDVASQIFVVDAFQLEPGDVPTAYAPMTDEILPGSINANMIAANAITANEIAADAISTSELAAGAVTADEIGADAVTAVKIAAGAVTANKLNVVMGGGNLVANSNFADVTLRGWINRGGGTMTSASTAGYYGGKSLGLASTAGTVITVRGAAGYGAENADNLIAVIPGQKITMSAWFTAGGGVWRVGFEYLSAAGAYHSESVGGDAGVVAGTRVAYTHTVPAGANFVTPRIDCTSNGAGANVGAVQLEIGDVPTAYSPKTDEILPGSINANMIAANAITANEIQADAIGTSELAAGAVIAENITAGAVTTDKLTVASVGDNVVLNGNFREPNIPGTPTSAPLGWAAESTATNTVSSSVNGNDTYMQVVTTASPTGTVYQSGANGLIDASPGDQFYVEVGATSTGGGHLFNVVMHAYDRAGTYLSTAYGAAPAPWATTNGGLPSANRKGAVLAVPAGTAAGVRFGVVTGSGSATYLFDKFIVGRVQVSARIADGAITANKVLAGAITANKLNVVMGGGNLLSNSSFENTAAIGGATNGSTIATETGVVYRGTRSVKVTLPTGAGSFTGLTANAVQYVPANFFKPNTRYTFSAWWYNPTTGGQPGGLILSAQGPVTAVDPSITSTVRDSWVKQSLSFTTTTGSAPSIYVLNATASTAGAFFYVGAIQVEEGDVGTAYAPKTDEILPGTIQANMIVANSLTSTEIQADAIGVSELAAGAVVADKIAVNAVTADKITVGTLGEQLVLNGGFEDDVSGTNGGWTLGANGSRIAAAARSGGFGLRLTAAAPVGASSRQFPVAAGDLLSVTAYAKQVTATTALYLRLSWRNSAGAEISTHDVTPGSATTTAWLRYGGAAIAAPVGTVGAIFQIYNTSGSVDVDDVTVRPVVISAQIADGAITAPKIVAGAITAEKLTIGSLRQGLVLNGSFEEADVTGAPAGWKIVETSGTAGTLTAPVDATALSGTRVGSLGPGSSAFGAKAFPVVAGRVYHWRFLAKHSNGNGSHYWRLNYGTTTDIDGYITSANRTGLTDYEGGVANTGLNGVWVAHEYTWTCPANVDWVSPSFYNYPSTGTLLVDDVRMDEVTVTAQIADGAITGQKIKANEVTANKLSVVMGNGNLLADAGFEGMNVGQQWAVTNGTASVDRTAVTDMPLSKWAVRTYGASSADTWLMPVTRPALLANQKYVLTGWVYKASASTSGPQRILSVSYTGFFNETPTQMDGVTAVNLNTLAPGAWTRVMVKFSPTVNIAENGWEIRAYIPTSAAANYLAWDNLQLEVGDVPSSYSPRVDEILPGTVAANQLSTDFLTATDALITGLKTVDLSAVTFTGTTVQTRDVAERGIKFGKVDDAELLVAYKENGDVFFKVDPLAGVTLTTGEARVQTLTVSSADPLVTPGSSLGGITEIAAGGRVLLTGGTTAPKSAPTVTAGYDQVQFTDDGYWVDRRGWVTNGTDWFTARVSFNRPVIERWSSAGVLLQSNIETAVYITAGGLMGLTIMGGAIYTLSRPNDNNFFVNKWNITTLARETVGGASGLLWAESDGGLNDAAIGSDGTDLLIAQTRASLANKVHIRRYTNGGGAALVAGTWVETTTDWPVNMRSVLLTNADFGASRYVLMKKKDGDVRTATTAGVFQAGEYFTPGASERVGLAYHNSAFRSMDASGIMRTHTSNWSLNSTDQTKWVSNTLANATVETDQSPRAKFILPQRARLDVTTAPIVSGGSADRIQIYIGVGVLDPGRAAMWRQTSPATGVNTARYSSLTYGTGFNPPAANLFPKGAACDVVSSTGGFAVDSSSNGTVGTGTFRDSIIAALQERVREGSFTAVITAADTTVETPVTFATPFPATVPIPTHVNMTLQNVTGSPSVRVSVKAGTLTRSGFTAQTWRSIGSVNLSFTYHVESVG